MVQSGYMIVGTTAHEIATSIETAVIAGELRPGDQLPPVRSLAAECGVSPATAAGAYRRLQERGFVHSDGRRGTRVVPQASGTAAAVAPAAPSDRGRSKITSHGPHVWRQSASGAPLRDLANGNPDPALLPDLRHVVDRLA